MPNRVSRADSVLITAPIGADAANIRSVLLAAGLAPRICTSAAELRAGINDACGAVILTEEALTVELCDLLAELFAAQPAWSDVPVVLIASVGVSNTSSLVTARLRGRGR